MWLNKVNLISAVIGKGCKMTPLISSLQQLLVSLFSVVTHVNLYVPLFFMPKPQKTYLCVFGFNYFEVVMIREV